MTLRQLWWMWAGSMENNRQLLWSHGWVISKVFGGKVSSAEIESFIRYGSPSTSPEPPFPGVHEKVAEILKTGRVTFG